MRAKIGFLALYPLSYIIIGDDGRIRTDNLYLMEGNRTSGARPEC